MTITLLIALLLPLVWPSQFGSWPGLLILLGLLWQPVFLLSPTLPPTWAALSLWIMLLACVISPVALGIFLWRWQTAPYVALAGYALFPLVFTLLLNRLGNPLELAGSEGDLVGAITWLAGMWYPMWGLCLGGIALPLGLIVLLLREARGAVLSTVSTPPEARE
ncbi:MAG: hypothetical protein KF893_09920 [Caldilineaceae bacterium]|nr:hypothetical protein [Caldilineaceae bacterium]